MVEEISSVNAAPPAASAEQGNSTSASKSNQANQDNHTAKSGNVPQGNDANKNNAARKEKSVSNSKNTHRSEGADGKAAAKNTNNVEVAEEVAAYEHAQQIVQASEGIHSASQDETGIQTAVLLNLSPQALNILNGIGGALDATGNITFSGSVGANLTVQQQQSLAGIVVEFGNAPFDENTFHRMHEAIVAAGIDPNHISLQEVLQGGIATTSPTVNNSEVVNSELGTDLLAS